MKNILLKKKRSRSECMSKYSDALIDDPNSLLVFFFFNKSNANEAKQLHFVNWQGLFYVIFFFYLGGIVFHEIDLLRIR